MEALFALLLKPEVLAVLGPVGIWALLASYGCWYMFRVYKKDMQDKHNEVKDLQEKRLEEAQESVKDTMELTQEVQKTMDILIKTVGKKNGGNGGQS